MKQEAKVVKDENGQYYAHIERPSACQKCGGCGGAEFRMKLENGEVGKCQIEMQEGRVLLASGIAYGIPLIGLLLGLMVGYPLTGVLGISMPADLFAAVCGLGLMIVCWVVIRLLSPWMRRKGWFVPKVTMMPKDKN